MWIFFHYSLLTGENLVQKYLLLILFITFSFHWMFVIKIWKGFINHNSSSQFLLWNENNPRDNTAERKTSFARWFRNKSVERLARSLSHKINLCRALIFTEVDKMLPIKSHKFEIQLQNDTFVDCSLFFLRMKKKKTINYFNNFSFAFFLSLQNKFKFFLPPALPQFKTVHPKCDSAFFYYFQVEGRKKSMTLSAEIVKALAMVVLENFVSWRISSQWKSEEKPSVIVQKLSATNKKKGRCRLRFYCRNKIKIFTR